MNPAPPKPPGRDAPEAEPPRIPLQELVGSQLGDYAIRRVLGYGSMGVVFEAVQVKLDRRVALKVLPPGLGATEKAIQRFLREAQAVAQLSHENIVPIFEIGNSGATHFYAMEFLDGESLDRVLKRGPLEAREAAGLACTAARAIHFAHQRGIIHRDVKPANMIRRSDGRLVLTDFGLARQEQGGSITDSGALVGTPLYMSPEQVRAKRGELDRRTDVWSLGATLYEMVAGCPPFPGETTQEILQAILDEDPRPPRTVRADVPPDLEIICMRALEKEPRRRYGSALEFAQDLERFVEGEPVLARRTTVVARGWRRIRKHRTIALLSTAVGVITVALFFAIGGAVATLKERNFRAALDQGTASYDEENNLPALAKFDEALAITPGHPAALLKRARARFSLGQEWEGATTTAGSEPLPDLQKRFGSVDQLYELASADIEEVAVSEPADPLVLFYRGALRWRCGETRLDRETGLGLISEADLKGPNDWETQAELARFRLGLAAAEQRGPDMKSELLLGALTNASRALKATKLAGGGAGGGRTALASTRRAVRLRRLRAEIYFELYKAAGNTELYLELGKTECEEALELDPKDERARTVLATLNSRLKDAATERNKPVATAPPRPDARGAADMTRGLLQIFGIAPASPQSEALSGLLDKGGELLATGWQLTDGVRGELMARFVDPFVKEGVFVTDEQRKEAAVEAEAARQILRGAYEAGRIKPADGQRACELLQDAARKNPLNAQYLFELALVEQALGSPEAAYRELTRAVAIAKSNPIFFHQLAIVCHQLDRVDEALAHARMTEELAPGNPEFVANHVKVALAAAKAAEDAATRRPLLDEAGAALRELRGAASSPSAAGLQLGPLEREFIDLGGTPDGGAGGAAGGEKSGGGLR